MNRFAYRPDIDGLRAIAVLAVVAYHYGATWLPGGFTGVDIFFVISGFLITSLIRRELEEGTFSFSKFWMRRVRRIMPALLIMVSVSLGMAWLFLMPGDLESMGFQAVAAALGVSNFYFWRTSGYFDQVADLIPLLHTWSLGVEEQFYLVWPLLLLGTWKLARSRSGVMLCVVLAALLASFALSLYLTGSRPVAAFYLSPSRGWELALGAALTFIPAARSNASSLAQAGMGIVLVAWSLFSISTADPFPGWVATLPCLGTALLILAGSRRNAMSALLSATPLTLVGKLSYSIYLWHWPIWVFYRHFNNSVPADLPTTLSLLFATLVVSFLSWRFVEQPSRRPGTARRTLQLAGAFTLAIVVASAGVGATNGGSWRIPDRLRGMDSLATMWEWDCPASANLDGKYSELGEVCTFGARWDTADERIVLWGDSHAEHMAPIIEALINGKSISVRLFRLCSAAISAEVQYTRADAPGYTEGCDITRDIAVDYLNANPAIGTVILAGYWWPLPNVLHEAGMTAGDRVQGLKLLQMGIQSVIDDGAARDRRFVVLSDVPHFRGVAPSTCNEPDALILRRACPESGSGLSRTEHLAEKGDVISALQLLGGDNTIVIDTGVGLCRSGSCQTVLNGEFIYRDAHHIRRNLAFETREELARLLGLNAIIR